MDYIGNWLASITLQVAAEGPVNLGTVAAPDFPFWHSLGKILAVLSGMVGLLLLVLYVWKRLAPRYQRHPALIQVLATHYLAPKQALILVAIGQEKFLLTSSTGNLNIVPLAGTELGATTESPRPSQLLES
jgi:flagellar biogenesis protein FliO